MHAEESMESRRRPGRPDATQVLGEPPLRTATHEDGSPLEEDELVRAGLQPAGDPEPQHDA